MLKDTYLKKVQPFINWLSENLYNETFEHRYRNRRSDQQLFFSSLYDAYEKYQWSHPRIERLRVEEGNTFATSAVALSVLRIDLRTSIAEESDEGACRAAVDVMRWGGVTAGNARWLNANKNGLAEMLKNTSDALNTNDSQHAILTDNALRFNAGMTKVYSLLNDDFIIYDSRVAAALGLAVVKYVENGNDIVAELLYPWLPAKEGVNARSPKNRDPGNGSLNFPKLGTGPIHAEWNLKASWLLQAVIDLDKDRKGTFSQLDEPLRALEAALFMIGYDIPNRSVSAQRVQPLPDPIPWTESLTLAHNIPFHYQVTEQGISIQEGPEFLDTIINATLFVLWDHFRNGAFPLQNSADKVPKGNAAMGLGVAYFQSSGKNPPDTSKLAAILEELDVIVRIDVENACGMHWVFNLEFLQLCLNDGSIDIRILLNKIRDREDEA